MILGIGCDIVAHATTEKLGWHTNPKIRARLFSTDELEAFPTQAKQQILFLAGKFAVKEAVLKCLGTGMIDGLSLKEIEVLKDDQQKPILLVSGETRKLAIEKGMIRWHLSISHTDSTTIAFVVAEGL